MTNHSFKVGCVVQGNWRPGTNLILTVLAEKFNYVCFSTWSDAQLTGSIPNNVDLLVNHKPISAGYTNRNLQRVSSIRGIRECINNSCDYILKIRTDMLATHIDIQSLISLSNTSPDSKFQKIIIPSTRCRSVSPDWFSSISDFYQFGPAHLMHLLWDDEEFDFSKKYNMPPLMPKDIEGLSFALMEKSNGNAFCAEQELYAWFKYRLCVLYGVDSDHPEIMKNNFYPYDNFKICWFGDRFKLSPLSIGFRPTKPGIFLDWWRPSDWKNYRPKVYLRSEIDKLSPSRSLLIYLLSPYLIIQILKQYIYFADFKMKRFFKKR